MVPKTKMAKLPFVLTMVLLLLLMSIINHSFSARTLGNPTPSYNLHDQNHPKITFLMQNVLNSTHPSSQEPATTKPKSQTLNPIPFPKPLGLFPPYGGIPLPHSNPAFSTQQPLDITSIGLSFPIRATLEEMVLGNVTEIEEDLLQITIYGSLVVGKAQGVFVASSEDEASHMVAMAAVFAKDGYKDGLRLFGVRKADVAESHIAVIGGIGKYHGANGYAVIKVVNLGSSASEDANMTNQFLSFDVYLS